MRIKRALLLLLCGSPTLLAGTDGTSYGRQACSADEACSLGAGDEEPFGAAASDAAIGEGEEALELLQRRGARLHRLAEGAPAVADVGASASNGGGGGGRAADVERELELERELAALEGGSGSGAAQGPAAGRPRPTLMGSFRRLLVDCDTHLGSQRRCSESILAGATDVFDVMEARNSEEVLTHAELDHFRKRFTRKLGEESPKVYGHPSLQERYRAWQGAINHTFTEMRPAITEALVGYVNRQSLGWTAEYNPEMVSASVADFRMRLGLDADDGGDSEAEPFLRGEDPTDELPAEPEGPFDVRENWPHCSDVVRHVRFQTCANCWSHATALITESRLCILLGGQLAGRKAWLSQSYVAACRVDNLDYCAGGGGTLGFRTVTRFGVPTGASDGNGNADPMVQTCFPQIPAKLKNVSCPMSCATATNYPRELEHDKFFVKYNPMVLRPSGAMTQLLAKRSLLEEGPIMIGFRAYQDLQAYVDGIYTPAKTPDNQSLGGHAVTAIGFGPGYYLCTNSWGDKWGINGTFMLAVEAIDVGYYLPGPVTYGRETLNNSFPLPIP